MSIPSPNLDDRNFQQLLDESILRIKQSCPKWSDLSPGDPGMALLELFAFLTDTMIYRLNRVPEKMYVEFLKLLGTRLLPPAAACARLRFSVKKPALKPIEIPRGTRVTIARSATGKEPPVFVVAKDVQIPAGQTETTVLAYHAEWVQEELSAKASGETGFAFTVKRPPLLPVCRMALTLAWGWKPWRARLMAGRPPTDLVTRLFALGRKFKILPTSKRTALSMSLIGLRV